MAEKRYSPQQAALAVLAKAQELYKTSTLAKSEKTMEKGDWAKIHSKLKREGYSEESADKIDGAIKAKMNKSDDMDPNMTMSMSEKNPDEKADAELGEKIEHEVESHEEQNDAPEHKMKGHIKLAKFMGRMEHKRGQKAKEMEKGEDLLNPVAGERIKRAEGYKKQGDQMSNQIAREGAIGSHKERLEGIKQAPKPKFGKGM